MNRKPVYALLGGVGLILLSPAPAAAAVVETDYFREFFVKGGPIVWCLLLPLSVCTISLTIAYVVRIRRSYLLPELVQAQIKELFESRKYREALEFTTVDTSMLSQVTHSALSEAAAGYAAMEHAVEEAAEEETIRVMRRIEWLNVIGNIAPMLGLFGTVTGMIQAFNQIVNAGGMPDPKELAGGISTALVTTFWGLAVAIPALAVYAVFRNRVDVLSAEVAVAAQELIAPFKPAPRSGASQAKRPSPAQRPAAGGSTPGGKPA